MKRYEIILTTNEKLVGTAKEVADQLRSTSKFEQDISTRKFMKRMANRIKIAYGQKINTWSYKWFVESLIKSDLVKTYKILKNEKEK